MFARQAHSRLTSFAKRFCSHALARMPSVAVWVAACIWTLSSEFNAMFEAEVTAKDRSGEPRYGPRYRI